MRLLTCTGSTCRSTVHAKRFHAFVQCQKIATLETFFGGGGGGVLDSRTPTKNHQAFIEGGKKIETRVERIEELEERVLLQYYIYVWE